MAKETLPGWPTGWKEKSVRDVFNSMSDKQKNEMRILLDQEKSHDDLLENLDDNNCCDRLLEAYKSFAGSEIVRHPSWMKVINHPLFLPERYSGIMLIDREKQIYHLDELTKDDIYFSIKINNSYVDFTLSELENESEPLVDDLIMDKEIRDKAKAKIIKFLREALTYKWYSE